MVSLPNYRGYRFPPEIISHTVWLYHRFTLSVRDIEDLLAERNMWENRTSGSPSGDWKRSHGTD